MAWSTTLKKFAELIRLLLNRLDKYEQNKQQAALDERRKQVAAKPDAAFADLFGKPDGVSERPAESGAVRTHGAPAELANDPERRRLPE